MAAAERKEPNRLDPISEPTLNLRIWGAYLRAGYTRATFAKALEVNYNVVLNWDQGRNAISLPYLIKAHERVGYTLDELVYGHAASNPGAGGQRREDPLTDDGVRAVLAEIRATQDQIGALGEHRESRAGRFQPMTKTYVVAFCSAYAAAREKNKTAPVAMRAAVNAAVNAKAMIDASSDGRRPLGDLTRVDGEAVPAPEPKKERKKILRVPTRGLH